LAQQDPVSDAAVAAFAAIAATDLKWLTIADERNV
jgi:hypothetical protein